VDGSFIACSISVLQWLLNAETSHPTSSPPHRLNRFFTTLYSALRNPSRAVLQFYPSSDDQIQLITSIAQKAGFGGGIVVDYPNSKKARKVFLCLFVGGGGGQRQQLPKGLETENEQVPFERRREKEKKRERSGKRKSLKDRDWILKKKEVSPLVLAVAFRLESFCLAVVSSEGKGGCSSRLKIYWAETQAGVLIFFCPFIHPGRQYIWTCAYYIPAVCHVRLSTKSSRHPTTASLAPFRMNWPWRVAMLIRRP